MHFLERDLEDIIYNSDKSKLFDRGLPISGKIKRQVKIGNYGIADLVSFKKGVFVNDGMGGFHMNPSITVFELKNDLIDEKAFFQAVRYLKGVRSYFDNNRNIGVDEIDFKIVLIGKRIDKNSSFIYLPDLIDNVFIYTYEYNIDGINFIRVNNYSLINEGF